MFAHGFPCGMIARPRGMRRTTSSAGPSARTAGAIERAYGDLKPPSLGRYGETTSRDDEVI